MFKNGNGNVLKIYRAVTIIVIAAGVIGIFNMNGSIIRIDERLNLFDFRLITIERDMYISGVHPDG